MPSTASRFKRYLELVETLGMSQVGAGKFLDIGERTVRRWASQEIDVPLTVMMLLETMVKYDLTPHQVRALTAKPDKRTDYSDQRRADDD